ncbi:MAG: hypothetical protein II007_13160 [Gammaproteobacteria bacterium]|nr:hypothetical protein [Gammaproteobacteria bacterium]
MKLWIAVAALALAPSFSHAGPIDHGWYTESGGLHWLDINLNSSDYGSGWRLATLDEFSSLAGDFRAPEVDVRKFEYHGWNALPYTVGHDWATRDALIMLTTVIPPSDGCQPDLYVSCYQQLRLVGQLADDPDLPFDEPFGALFWEFERVWEEDPLKWDEYRSAAVSGPGGPYSWSPGGYDGSFMVRASDWADVPVPAPASLLLFGLLGVLPLMRRQR